MGHDVGKRRLVYELLLLFHRVGTECVTRFLMQPCKNRQMPKRTKEIYANVDDRQRAT